MSIGQLFLESVTKRFAEYKKLGERTFAQLTEEHMHRQPNEASNSIAVIIQHAHGNMLSRWTHFLTEDGEKEWRQRDEEFEVHSLTKDQLMELWNDGWQVLFSALSSLSPDDLLRTITIRNEPHFVVDAINRQVAHYSYHVGQIVYIGKYIRSAEWQTLSVSKNILQPSTKG